MIHSHSDIIYTYFRAEKKAREFGFRTSCYWKEGVFRLYRGDKCLEANEDILEFNECLNMHIENEKKMLGI